MSAVIGIDVGSSAIKGVLLDEDTVLCTERTPIPTQLTTDPQHFEHDPIAVRDAAFDLIRLLSRRARDAGQGIRAIAFTGQMHGGLIVDDKLRPLTNFVTWQDKRGTSMLDELDRMFPHDPTGVGIHNGFLLATLSWWKTNGGFPAGSAHILGIYDGLTSLLAGRAVTDITSVAAWAMFDPVRKE